MFENMGLALLAGGVILLLLFLKSFIRIVPQNEAYRQLPVTTSRLVLMVFCI